MILKKQADGELCIVWDDMHSKAVLYEPKNKVLVGRPTDSIATYIQLLNGSELYIDR